MEWNTYLLPFIIISLLLGLGLVFYWAMRRSKHIALPIQYDRSEPKVPFFIKEVDQSIPFNGEGFTLELQSQGWREAMRHVGLRLNRHHVSQLFFVHGTFAGDDPFGVVPAMQRIFPKLETSFAENIQGKIKRRFDHLQRDSGNYLHDYVQLFKEATQCDAECQLFVWSSGNHHAARLKGAILLFRRLYQNLPDIPASTVLLWGHSHAGQVFALLSHLLQLSPLGERLWELLLDSGWAEASDRQHVQRLQKFNYDFMTFGAPLRYPWRLSQKVRLLSVVNHRGSNHLAAQPFGFWKTQAGDYIQQWGIHGSDSPASFGLERRLNRELDKVLGLGIDPRGWLENVAKGMRVSEYGVTYLIDYKDQSRLMPNGLTSIFGHGVYTRFEHMLFNAQLCCDVFYPSQAQDIGRNARQKGKLIEKADRFFKPQ